MDFSTGVLSFSAILTCMLLVTSTVFPCISLIFLYKNKNLLVSENTVFQERYGCLYEGVNVSNTWSLCHVPLFMLRRLIYGASIVAMRDYPVL